MSSFSTQVSGESYKKSRYLTLERFISYYFQFKEVTSLPVESLLEIGIGNGIVSAGLRQMGYKVTTCDFDASVQPDVVADVRHLPLPDQSQDLVMACQILEHLPFEEFETTLRELMRVSRKYVLISLPRRHTGFELIIKIPGIQTLLKRSYVDLAALIPLRFPGFAESGQHYWEIDTWQVSLKQVKEVMERVGVVKKVFSPPMNKYHVFFLVESKKA